MNEQAGRSVTGMGRSSEGLDARRKRMLFRAWHRGTKELDILLGSFADAHLATMDDRELDAFERLMEVPEPDLYNWIAGRAPMPDNYQGPLMAKIIAFHAEGGAVFTG
ncbi:MAG: succinate dehydrogenase assembly factor 2 [Devosiaceae bacterium]|nr:succinate dehydrogenase assembly factor 2 [Devosiaceae bacterium MH13]